MIFSCCYRSKKAQAQHHVRPRTRQAEERAGALSLSRSLLLAHIRVNNYDKRRIEEKQSGQQIIFSKKEKEEILRDRTSNQSIDRSIYCHPEQTEYHLIAPIIDIKFCSFLSLSPGFSTMAQVSQSLRFHVNDHLIFLLISFFVFCSNRLAIKNFYGIMTNVNMWRNFKCIQRNCQIFPWNYYPVIWPICNILH